MLQRGARGLITFGKEKPDRILVFIKADGTGLMFIKRRPDGALGKLFCVVHLYANRVQWPARLVLLSRLQAAMPLPLWRQYAALSQMPRACVRLTKREDLLARSAACR